MSDFDFDAWYKVKLSEQSTSLNHIQKVLAFDRSICRAFSNQLLRQEPVDISQFFSIMQRLTVEYQIAGGEDFNQDLAAKQEVLYQSSTQPVYMDVLINLAHLSPKVDIDDAKKMMIFTQYLKVIRPKVHQAVESVILKTSNPLSAVPPF